VVRKGRARGIGVRGVGVAVVAAILMSGCVTVQKAGGSPEALRQAIRAGEVIQPGDRVTVVTTTMGERTFTVTAVEEDSIRDGATRIPIDEVVALEKHRIDAGKTIALVGGAYLGLYLAAALAFLVALGDI